MQLAVLDADGYAVCPDCGTRVKCGSAGLANLEKRHRTKGVPKFSVSLGIGKSGEKVRHQCPAAVSIMR